MKGTLSASGECVNTLGSGLAPLAGLHTLYPCVRGGTAGAGGSVAALYFVVFVLLAGLARWDEKNPKAMRAPRQNTRDTFHSHVSEWLPPQREAGTAEQFRHEKHNRSSFISDDLIYLWTSILKHKVVQTGLREECKEGAGPTQLSFPRQAARIEMRETTRHAAGFGVFTVPPPDPRGRPALCVLRMMAAQAAHDLAVHRRGDQLHGRGAARPPMTH